VTIDAMGCQKTIAAEIIQTGWRLRIGAKGQSRNLARRSKAVLEGWNPQAGEDEIFCFPM